MNIICNNCGMSGHLMQKCKLPITSYGIIVYNITTNRYDAVFHLVTAADGAQSFYTLENNKGSVNLCYLHLFLLILLLLLSLLLSLLSL